MGDASYLIALTVRPTVRAPRLASEIVYVTAVPPRLPVEVSQFWVTALSC